MAINRKATRDLIVALLTPALVGSGLPAAQVLGHKAGAADFATGTPLVCVLSKGTHRQRMTGRGSRATFKLELHTLVLSASEDGTTWTEAMAEDRLDLIEATVAGVVDGYNSSTAKSDKAGMILLGESDVAEVAIGGAAYLEEITPCEVEVYG